MSRVLVMFAAIFSSYVFLYITVIALSETECLSYGYPSVRVDVSLHSYCVKRVNQTDIVIPLINAAKEK